MPGSHGGGGGGGHSSHSGSFSGSGSSTHFSPNKPFPGARRYYYHTPYGTRYFYSSIVPRRRTIWSVIFGPFIALLFLLLVGVISYFTVVNPSPLSSSQCQQTVYVYDNIDVIDNKADLIDSLSAFYEKTGVQPVVYTNSLADYSKEYGSFSQGKIESYAYDVYMDLFNDEGHWLIVYIESSTKDEWYWCDMYGDDTGNIITDYLFYDFQDQLQADLEKTSVSTGQALVNAFDLATSEALEWNTNRIGELAPFGIMSLFILFIIIVSLTAGIREYKMMNDYCNYREKENGGKDSFTEVDKDDFKIDQSEYDIKKEFEDDKNRY